MVISISRNGLLKAYAWFFIERSEIRKKQRDFKSVPFEFRMVPFYMGEKSTFFLNPKMRKYMRNCEKTVHLG